MTPALSDGVERRSDLDSAKVTSEKQDCEQDEHCCVINIEEDASGREQRAVEMQEATGKEAPHQSSNALFPFIGPPFCDS